MDALIYKIVPEKLWQEARKSGRFEGSGIDLTDGYIHFSTAAQAKRTAELHFTGQTGLLLVGVETAKLGDALVYEPSRGGDLFPHFYGVLELDAVAWEKPLPVGGDGRHIFPEM